MIGLILLSGKAWRAFEMTAEKLYLQATANRAGLYQSQHPTPTALGSDLAYFLK